MHRLATCITLFYFLHAIAACTTSSPPVESETAPMRLDAELLQMAERVPQFGGLYFDEAGRLTVYLTAPAEDLGPAELASRERQVWDAIRAVYGPTLMSATEPDAAPLEQAELRIVRGDYTIQQLAPWAVKLVRALDVPGVVSKEIDERRNRVRIGIADEKARTEVQRLVAEAGIPAAAVLIEARAPIRFQQTLRDRERPVPGGMEIQRSGGICTMGFNATLGSGATGFITNSHCTRIHGGPEDTDFSQPFWPFLCVPWFGGDCNFVGTELRDPAFTTAAPCPEGRRCRLSDSAFIEYKGTLQGWNIARTMGQNDGSVDLVGQLTIAGESTALIMGARLDKVGRTTGWTFGTITDTCTDFTVDGTDITLLCQGGVTRAAGQAQPMSGRGDSGSPVFRPAGTGSTLFGILWGGDDNDDLFSFSPINQIEAELGPLATESPSSDPSEPPLCPAGERCCEMGDDGTCRLCVPNAAECP